LSNPLRLTPFPLCKQTFVSQPGAAISNLNDLTTGLLHYIYPSSKSSAVVRFVEIFEADIFTSLVQEFSNHFNQYNRIEKRHNHKSKEPILGKKHLETLANTAKFLLIFIGKTYQFSGSFSIDPLWTDLGDKVAWTKREGFSNEYFYCLSRIATTPALQTQYFGYFDRYYQSNDYYLWGYGRILMWYFDFSEMGQNQASQSIDYRNHFRKIVQYLDEQSTKTNWQNKQNGFLALIYLLTFRMIDTDFCQPHTPERQMAEQMLSRYEGTDVRFKQIDTPKSLNQLFQELLEGNASETDVDALIHGS
jgi:hypothetical protein